MWFGIYIYIYMRGLRVVCCQRHSLNLFGRPRDLLDLTEQVSRTYSIVTSLPVPLSLADELVKARLHYPHHPYR